MPVLVTGATGYVGGRLIPKLLEMGFAVRAMGRSVAKLEGKTWAESPNVELAAGDVLDPASLEPVLRGCSAAFYLVHSMLPGQGDFEDADRVAAGNFRDAAAAAGVGRIVYLGGLGDDGPGLSAHLKSRDEVGKILSEGSVPVTVFRAAAIIGSGSSSFEILRYLVDRLPVMITPRWLSTPNQPIAIRNVVGYLAGCLRRPETAGRTFDIGGSEALTYRRLMEIYAEEAGLPKRFIIPVPVLTPRLSSYWIHLVTPLPASIARPLAEGLRNPVVCRENSIREIIPQDILSPREAIRLALGAATGDAVPTHWSDAGPLPPAERAHPGDPEWSGGTVLSDRRETVVEVGAPAVWDAIVRIGGRNGWYHADRLWAFRGFLDKLAGGVGLRRGRRNDLSLRTGDALDFWRVIRVEKERRLRLLAEMKVPGTATLEFSMRDAGKGVRLSQTASFVPRGLLGILYWYLLLPVHHYVFGGMLKGIADRARATEAEPRSETREARGAHG